MEGKTREDNRGGIREVRGDREKEKRGKDARRDEQKGRRRVRWESKRR